MSLDKVAIAGGTALAIYGGYKYVSGNEQEKKTALICMAAGVAAISVGVLGFSTFSQSSIERTATVFSETPIAQPSVQPALVLPPVVESSIDKMEGVANCSLNALKNLINKGEENSITARTFKVLEETQGISCENFLPWKESFHRGGTGYIDGVQPDDLQKAVHWGIDRWQRPFISIKYLCNVPKQLGVTTVFQRYTNDGTLMVPGSHFEASNCRPDLASLLKPHGDSKQYLEYFTALLKGQEITGKQYDYISVISLAS